MFWKSQNSKFNSLIARIIQTTGDFIAYYYFHILTFPFLTNFLISDNNILLYQRNIKEISKKYQRNKFLFIEANYFYTLRGLKSLESRFAADKIFNKYSLKVFVAAPSQFCIDLGL
jgi:hypothetical protein